MDSRKPQTKLSQRSYHGLVTYGIYHIRTVADLLRLSLADLRKLRNLGDKSIAEIAQGITMS